MGTTRDAGRELVEDTIEHYGVKGMKWGIRKDRRSRSETAVTVKTKKGKGVVKTSGGKGREASEEAVKKAAVRQKGKASSLDALTNEELRAFNQRKELETKYMSYVAKEQAKKSKGRSFVDNLMKQEYDAISSGKVGPTLKAAIAIAAAASVIGVGASGKHRGKFSVGGLTLSTIRAAGTGKHRKM